MCDSDTNSGANRVVNCFSTPGSRGDAGGADTLVFGCLAPPADFLEPGVSDDRRLLSVLGTADVDGAGFVGVPKPFALAAVAAGGVAGGTCAATVVGDAEVVADDFLRVGNLRSAAVAPLGLIFGFGVRPDRTGAGAASTLIGADSDAEPLPLPVPRPPLLRFGADDAAAAVVVSSIEAESFSNSDCGGGGG